MDEDLKIGVKINLISNRKLDSMTSQEKLRFILDEIKNGTVLVLERGLTAEEEIDLIKTTMSEIDHQTFIGIEMQSYSSNDLARESWFSKLLGRTKAPKMSVIGPANLLKTIHKNGTMIQTMVLTGKSIVSDLPTEPTAETPEGDELDREPETERRGEPLPIKKPKPPEFGETADMEETAVEPTKPQQESESPTQPPLATPAEEVTYQDSTIVEGAQQAQEVPDDTNLSPIEQIAPDEAAETGDLPPSADAPPEIPPPPDTTPPEPEQQQDKGFLYKRLKYEEE